MIKIDSKYSNVKNLKSKIKLDKPIFSQYIPDFKNIEKLASKYKKKKNIIIIGNGGSITSFNYFYTALGSKTKIHIIATMEPDVLNSTRKICNKKDTVILTISKSGNTVGVIESLVYFIDYPSIIIITENKKSALKEIQEKYSFEFIEHPPIGGRYSGFTPSGLLPAAISGMDIKRIWKGAEKAYKIYGPNKNNKAVELASMLYELDKKGYNEIFMPIYSSKLLGSKDIITQLIHESVGKKQKGQTLLGTFAPESQHHTNQRFFGGKKNILGLFIILDEYDNKYDKVTIPNNIKEIALRDGKLMDLNNNFYSQALYYEFVGTRNDANKNRIPNIVLHLDKITPETIGEYLAFWHYVTVYNSILNNVDPYDQPQVENSKTISFKLRKK
jgi:glucose-6-phosphate isomerase